MNKRLIAPLLFATFSFFAAAPASALVICDGATDVDSDGDGFSDLLECTGIPINTGTLPSSDPNTRDLFVILAPASASLLPPRSDGTPFNPFLPATYVGSGVNVTFNGLASLGLTVHVVAPADVQVDRTVTLGSTQKAVRIAESTDTNGTILGNCQWGTPDGLDGCVVYTQRIKNFIDTTCPGNTPDERALMFNAYITQSFLHEVGHSLGGLTADYNSRFGGYHYKSGSALVMEQSISYSAKSGKCTWYISSGWNPTLDVPAIRLQ